jgi:stage IV sporulation protein FB
VQLIKVGDTPILLNPFFLLLLLGTALGGFLAETLLLFLIIFLHEVAHAVTAKGLGLNVVEIELYPFGGVARLEEVLELDPSTEKNVSLAGPVFNFVLAGAALVLYMNQIYTGGGLLFFVRLNLMLGFFNLLPALPLDGGRVLRASLAPGLGFQKATDFCLRLSRLLAFLILSAGLGLVWLGFTGTPALFLPAFFCCMPWRKKAKKLCFSLCATWSGKVRIWMIRAPCPRFISSPGKTHP